MDDNTQPTPVQTPPPRPVNRPSDIITPSPRPVVPPAGSAPGQPPAQPQAPPTSPKKGKTWLWAIIVVIILAVLAGSGYMYWHNHHKATQKTAATSTAKKYDVPLIRYGFQNNPLNAFYPSQASFQGAYPVQHQIFEGLVSFQNGTQIKPTLASSWTNPNNTTWVFKLKPNIHYHNGDVVTAADVVYSWQKVKASNPGSSSSGSYVIDTIKDVTAVNDSTVKITTLQPDGILLNRLTNLLILDSKAPAKTPVWDRGTGAYTVKSGVTPTPNSLDLVAYQGWHGGHVYTKAIDYTFYADPSKEAQDLQAGKLDVVDLLNPSPATDQLKQNYHVFKTPTASTNILLLTTTNPNFPTANIKIRHALNLAVNQQDIITNAQQTGTPANQVVPPSVPGYNPAIKSVQQNITQAAALVKAAGYPNGVTINVLVGGPVIAEAQEVAKEVKPAGITLKITTVSSEEQFFNKVSSGTVEAFFEGAGSQVLDGSDILANWQNQPWYNNATFNTELNKANSIFSAQPRLMALQTASKTLTDNYAYVPMFYEQILNASDKNLVFPLDYYDFDLNSYFANVYSTKPIQ